MDAGLRSKTLRRNDDRIIIHFDYDCFYASVFEAADPVLKSLPLAVQQKQIIVTCNYEARRRGLHKLQLIKEARKICPDVVIMLGEDLTCFRNASKELYNFLRSFSWGGKVERLGFDEVFLDVTDLIDYNISLLNPHNLSNSFFCLCKGDPTVGFAFDATHVAGYTFPGSSSETPLDMAESQDFRIRLHLGSHLAFHLRKLLEEEKCYTATVGISTSKLLSKLVGNVNKPNGQTTLMPPYEDNEVRGGENLHSNVTTFIDGHEVGKIPGIGFKLAQKIREHILQRPAKFDTGLIYGGTKEKVTVREVRMHPNINPITLENLLGGPGSPHEIGSKVWGLIHGIDDTEVGQAREVPRQISIEDSYMRLDTFDEVMKELRQLSKSLINRMRLDLVEEADDDFTPHASKPEPHQEGVKQIDMTKVKKRWLAHPKTLRLTTRPRPPLNPDGSRTRTFNRISRSAELPNYVFSLSSGVDFIADRLAKESLVPLFRRLHPEKSGWDLGLINVAVTNMVDAAGEGKDATGRDIVKMFSRQNDVLKDWKVEDRDIPPDELPNVFNNTLPNAAPLEADAAIGAEHSTADVPEGSRHGSEDLPTPSQDDLAASGEGEWNLDMDVDPENEDSFFCDTCGAMMPAFAIVAHQRFHALGD